MIADHTARHPLLAPLFLPFWTLLRRLFGTLDALLAAFRAGTLALPEPGAPRPRATPPVAAVRQSSLRAPCTRPARPDSVPASPAGSPVAEPRRTPGIPPSAPRAARPVRPRSRDQIPLRHFSGASPLMPNCAYIIPIS